MPRVTFTENNVKKNDFAYPKLRLKKDEVARVVLLEDPEAEFVHNIRKPKLNGGVAETEIKTRFKDQTQYEDYKYEFVGRPICLGDFATLEKDGSDPKLCPICAEALKSDKFSAPQRRFALHVVKYETLPGKTEVKTPFQASTLIWSFTDRVFNKLFEFKNEWGDLRNRDLILKCENEAFQTYDISVAAKAEWTTDETRQAYIKELFSPDNLAPDLSVFCGSKKTENQLSYDIQAVNETWAVIQGTSTISSNDSAMSSVGGSLTGGIDSILDGTFNANKAEETEAKTDADGWAVDPKDIASAEESTSKSTADLDDILKGL